MKNGKLGGTRSYFAPSILVYDLAPPLISTAQDVRKGNQDLLQALDGKPSCTYEEIDARMLGKDYAY